MSYRGMILAPIQLIQFFFNNKNNNILNPKFILE